MRIGVIAQRMHQQPLGIGRYIEYLLKYWNELLPAEDSMDLLAPQPLDNLQFELGSRIGVDVVSPALPGLLWENLVLPRRRRSIDVLFGPSYTLPAFYQGPAVVVIHSVNEREEGAHSQWYRFTYEQRYRRSAAAANVVIAPSHSVAADIHEFYGVPESKIRPIWLGVDDVFRPLEDAELLHETRRRWVGEDVPYMIFVGKLSQRRNIPNLIRAFARFKKSTGLPHRLLLFGPNHLELPLKEVAEENGVAGEVIQTDGKIQHHDELVAVYSAADLYVSASLYEGASMTVLEAMACGRPVIVTNRGAMAEQVAGFGVQIETDPRTPEFQEDLADALERVLTDPGMRQDLSAKSLQRAQEFRWKDAAQKTLDVIREAGAAAS